MMLVILFACFVVIGLPLLLSWQIWRLDVPTRQAWCFAAALKVAAVSLVLLVGRWDIGGMWTRIILVGILLVALLASWRKHAGRPWRASRRISGEGLGTLAPLALCMLLGVYMVVGMLPRSAPTDLAFPLRGGSFVVAQGGGNLLLNRHRTHSAQKYAADITAVGQPLARVGNSGNSTGPHLHIHAIDPQTRAGVPLTFDGRPPVRNRTFVR